MNDLVKKKAFANTGKRLFAGGLVAAACLFPFTTPAQSSVLQQSLHGHVPGAVARLGLRPVGQLAGTAHLDLAIGLPLHDQAAFDELLQQIYDPASTNYHRFLTPEQFTGRFGPTEQDYQAVISFARANGLTVTGRHSNRVLLNVNGSAANIERAFRVKLGIYRHPTENRTFFAPDVEPSVPAGLPVLDVSGLNNYGRPQPRYHINPSTNAVPNAGTGPNGTYMGKDFRNAYAPNVTLTGAGQTIALVQFDGYRASDIALYETLAGLPNVPLQNVLIDGFDGLPTGSGGDVEVSLDIEMCISMAPGLSRVILYEGNPNNFNPNNVLNRIASDNSASQVSCSWGWTGGPNATTENIFKQMAAQGQSFFNASGDSDAFPSGAVDDPSQTGTPSSSPNITQVGGTTLTTTTNPVAFLSETVWNWGIEIGPSDDGVGSSGGISSFYSIPIWQVGVNMTNVGGSPISRNIPDVALTADNVFVVAGGGQRLSVGGTSCAAPLWAGFTALINQQAADIFNSPPGFLNPAIYAIGKNNAVYVLDFHDVKTGNNTWSGSPNLFLAATGYDLCTGWGSPNGQNLIDSLAGTPVRLGLLQTTVNPPGGSALISSSTQPIFVKVTDVVGVTNATVTATITGAVNTSLTLLNNGVSPDTAIDSTYSASLVIPAVQGQIAMTVIATNSNETSVTNTYYYTIISPPANDNFASPTKVPAMGGTYLSNNRLATMEIGEPKHDGVTTATNSLWWSFTPTSNTGVIVDTAGSATNFIVAVYTGTTLFNLVQVVATNQTYVNFNAVAGTAYSIAIASPNATTTGSIRLRIAPGGLPDTTPPAAIVVSPLSGLWVSNKLVYVSGTANDPGTAASGVNRVIVTVNGRYKFIADGTTNWACPAILKPGLNNLQAIAYDNAGNASAPANLQLTYFQSNPGNDLFANATPLVLTNNAGSVSAVTTNATREFGEPDHGGNPGGKSVWWSFQPPADGVLTLNTAGSSFDTLLGVYTGTDVSALTPIAENDDAYPSAPGGFSLVNQAVRASQTYYIAVDGYNGVGGTANLSYTFAPTNVFHLTTSSSTGGVVQVTSSNSLGGVAVMPGTAGDFAGGSTVILTGIPNSFYDFTNWSGGVTSSNNPLLVVMTGDLSVAGQFGLTVFTDGFESGNFSALNWTMAGNAPWFIQSQVVAAGQFAARSGVIGDGQTSSLILTTNNFLAGTGSFDFRVSSETNFDLLSFYEDGALLGQWSGEVGWATFSFPVTPGAHAMEWRYSKDATLSSGLDAAFLDNVNLPIDPPLAVVPAPASLQLQRQSNGMFVVNLSGQTNQQYILQVSTNLINWVNISTNTAVGGSVQIADPASVSNSTRFYRTLTVP